MEWLRWAALKLVGRREEGNQRATEQEGNGRAIEESRGWEHTACSVSREHVPYFRHGLRQADSLVARGRPWSVVRREGGEAERHEGAPGEPDWGCVAERDGQLGQASRETSSIAGQ